MPKVTMTVPVIITLDIPEEYAPRVSCDDIREMMRAVIPDSGTRPNPLPNGVQVTIDSCCQEEEGKPVFADVYHIEHDICEEPELEFEDDGFTKAEKE